MKKKNLLYIVCALAMGSLCGCDDFLNKDPQDKQTNDTYWQTETSLRTYAQDFYSSYFTGYGTDYTVFAGYFSGDDYTDDFINLNNANTNGSGYIYFSTSATTDWNSQTGTWSGNYSVIYKANVMLEKIPGMNISDEAKRHWEGIARYFRAMAYSTLAKYYGGVPYYDKVTDPADPALYKDRDSYLYVAQKIQEDFQYALDNVRTDDTKRQVNKYVVGAYMSREMLYHATWLKYHGTTVGPTSEKVADGDIKNLLQGAINGAEVVMNSGIYSIGNTYNALFTTDDLANNPEVIWYREYTSGLQCNALMSYNGPEDQTQGGVTQDVINTYLCSDGLPIGQSPLYQGKEDPSIQKSFQDRDPRLYHTVIPPYKVKSGKGDYPTWSYTDNPADREYIDIMGANESCSNPGVGMKRLPGQNWSASLVPEIPRLGTGAFVTCRSGYYVWKNWDNWETSFNNGNLNTADKPIFKIEEVLLNEAEAKFELGVFDQGVADKTINKLRDRAGVVKMVVADINDSFDPNRGKYYPKGNESGILVDPVLWEIRRERIIELMGEGFGIYDIRRWRMAPWFLNKPATGLWMSKEEAMKNNMTLYNPETGYSDGTDGSLTEGNLYLFNDPLKEGKGWLDKYYLYQVPTTEILLNPELEQNPGW